jgi:TolB protein
MCLFIITRIRFDAISTESQTSHHTIGTVMLLLRVAASVVVGIAMCHVGLDISAAEAGKKSATNIDTNLSQSIVFTSLRNRHLQLVLLDSNGVDAKELTSTPVNSTYPAWSPDGKQIVFASQDGLGRGLFVIAADGKNVRRLTHGTDTGAAWSPDGTKITYTHYLQSTKTRLMAIELDDPAAPRQTNGTGLPTTVSIVSALTDGSAFDADAAWSPDGKTIAFGSDRKGVFRLYLMNPDGTNVRDLSQWDNPGGNVYPAWSPDGKRIAYTEQVPDGTRQIFVIHIDGKSKAQLTSAGDFNSYAAWSKDGKKIAYMTYPKPNMKGSLAIMNPDGSGQQIILRDQGGRHNGRPAWNPK